mgnify:CR=1 FL=1
MFMNRFFGLLATTLALVGCTATPQNRDWMSEYGTDTAGAPAQVQYGGFSAMDENTHRVAVLLPLTGENAAAGRAIRTSVEMAILQSAPQNMSVAFYDTVRDGAINDALAENPEIIIGPVFAADARTIRETKPLETPVLSFTSDATAVGDGVMTMALMPTNSIEAITTEMSSDGVKSFIVLAPDTESGRLMAGTAKNAARIYNMELNGIFYYTPGNSDSIKDTAMAASMNTARTAANVRAREILSDILTNERLTTLENSGLTIQLEKISKSDTLGAIPYDAILFLGGGADTTSLASFLRYYGVSNRDARMYGTAMWDGTNITSDVTMYGAKYAALPEISPVFSELYERTSGTAPSHLAAFGYDATNLAMGMIYSQKSHAAYLLDPSGYVGTDGLFRLRPNGDSERALRILQIDASGTPRVVRAAPQNFITPIYNIQQRHITAAAPMELQTRGINPMDYIRIPQRLQDTYKSKTFGANMPVTAVPVVENITTVVADTDAPVAATDYAPVKLESVDRTYIDSVEISE